jgi:hypothetical protein
LKTLTKVVLIQWYRLEAVEIPIIGSTAFIGDNGAGKSAMLDAIQTVLTGANRNRLVLNRGSNEQSSRKLWEYVLGVMSDPKKPELATKIKPREKANCYLALNFHDAETGETTFVGLGIYASLADMAEKIEGYFICPGLVGHKDLFLEQRSGDATTVLPWARVKERLAKTCPGTRFHHEPGKFTQDLFGTLSEHPGLPNNDRTVLKALQAAFKLEKISDPTEFIRRYMLDRDDLQIKELQSALKNYRDMADKAESVSRRVSDLTRMEGCCDKLEQARLQQVQAEYVSLSVRSEQLEERANPLRDALADLEEGLERMAGKQIELEAQQSAQQELLGGRRAELKNCDLQIQRERLQFDLEKASQGERDLNARITEVRRLLQRFEEHGGLGSQDPLAKAIAALSRILPGDGMLSTVNWPADPAEADACLAALTGAMEQSLPGLSGDYNALCAELSGFAGRLKELVEAIKQLKHGKAPLQANTRNLILFYKKHGIDAKPLCELVDVADEAWRGSIESVLGNIREALIVIPEQARKAVSLYRYEGRREFPGCHIVNTTQTERWKKSAIEGTLAECLTTDNVHARAFVNRRLGTVVRVETEQDLLRHDRAATADGMLSTGGTVSEMRAIPPILGRGSRESMLASYERDLLELSAKQSEVEARAKKLGSLKDLLEDYRRRFAAEASFSLVSLVRDRAGFLEALRGAQEKLAALSLDEREQKLKEEIGRLEVAAEGLRNELKTLNEQHRVAERDYGKKEDELSGLESQMDVLQQVLKETRANPLLDPVKAADTLDRWREHHEGDFAALISKADHEIKAAQRTIEDNNAKIVRDYTEYFVRYAAEEGDEARPEQFEEYAAAIRRKKGHLVGTTLAEYRDKSARALLEAEDAFRSKFVGRLIGKLEAVRVSVAQLNKTLEKHPFHGETYKFRPSANPEFKHIIDFARACNSPVSQEAGGLFDPAAAPDSPFRKALDDITLALQDPKAAERLQDYRNFLVFDVEMCDSDGTPTADLEHRIQKGSGGENQTPFYVAIGASLAAAYRLKEEYGKHHGGMSLAVFDEAFSKLSVSTCHSCIEFLKGIQLQLLVAAPDEKFATMAEVMDTIVWVTRDGGTVETEVIFIKPAMRAMLRSDNPYRKASGTAEFLHEPS